MQNYKSISSIAIQFQNDFNDEDSGHASDELEFIINNILNMNKKVMNFESQLTSQMLQLKKSRTLILQSQINPHFIMNTLNSINLDISEVL